MSGADWLALGSGLILALFAFYFCWKIGKQQDVYVKCRVCGTPCKVPRETETVRKAEELFQGKAIPVIHCGKCGR